MRWRALSPDSSYVELVEDAVIADDGDVFELRLCDQHAVERVAMRSSNASGTLRMKEGDVQRTESLRGDASNDVGGHVDGADSLPSPNLVVISHAETALTRIAFVSLAIRRRALSGRRRSPSSHHRNACVSRRRRTQPLLPDFVSRKRVEEGARDPGAPAHRSETAADARRTQARQTGYRRRPTRTDHVTAALGLLDEP